MTEFTPWLSLTGGILIGLSAILLMLFNGRIAGMTGILGGVLPPFAPDWTWRAAFIAGAVMSPILFQSFVAPIEISVPVSNTALVASGLIVGVGVILGSGCTSGHGVCGMARLSPRSIVATVTFMLTGFITVFILRHVM
jgi:hypothetical protein